MEERDGQSLEAQEPAGPIAEPLVGRRQLLKMAAATGGALATMALLPETLGSTVEAQTTALGCLPAQRPRITYPFVCNCRASFVYYDPKRQVEDCKTLLGVNTASDGQLQFKTLSEWAPLIGLTRSGNSRTGTIKFRLNDLGFCNLNTSKKLCIQLAVGTVNATTRPSTTLCVKVKPRC